MGFLSGIGDQLKAAGGALIGSDYLRDYRHAAKTFRSNSYAYAPKYKFLFHTYFSINSEAWPDGVGKNFGILVKDIRLPTYNFTTLQLNQYNRKRIIQTKIKYDPVTISFHDDNSNTINKLWYAYYTYHYNDSNKPNVMFAGKRGSTPPANGTNNSQKLSMADYNVSNIYNDSITGNADWGFYGEAAKTNSNGQKLPFFQNITVFGFNQHSFTAYTLINPVITAFNHDTYNYEEGSGVMKNTMTIDYETVVYNEGAISGKKPEEIVTGFGDPANYDRKTSPWMQPGANGSILGPGGLVDGAGGVVSGFKQGGVSGILGAGLAAARTFNTAKNMDLATTAKYELLNMVAQSAWEYGSPIARNRNILFDIPNKSVTPYTIGTAGAPTIAPPATMNVTTIPNQTPIANAGVQVTTTNQVTGTNYISGGK